MFEKIITFHQNANWVRLTIAYIEILLGMYIYYHVYYHVSHNLDGSISILMLSGSLFIITGLLDFIYLTRKKSLTLKFVSVLVALAALVFYFYH